MYVVDGSSCVIDSVTFRGSRACSAGSTIMVDSGDMPSMGLMRNVLINDTVGLYCGAVMVVR